MVIAYSVLAVLSLLLVILIFSQPMQKETLGSVFIETPKSRGSFKLLQNLTVFIAICIFAVVLGYIILY